MKWVIISILVQISYIRMENARSVSDQNITDILNSTNYFSIIETEELNSNRINNETNIDETEKILGLINNVSDSAKDGSDAGKEPDSYNLIDKLVAPKKSYGPSIVSDKNRNKRESRDILESLSKKPGERHTIINNENKDLETPVNDKVGIENKPVIPATNIALIQTENNLTVTPLPKQTAKMEPDAEAVTNIRILREKLLDHLLDYFRDIAGDEIHNSSVIEEKLKNYYDSETYNDHPLQDVTKFLERQNDVKSNTENDINNISNEVTSIEDTNEVDKKLYMKNPVTKTEETKNNTVNLPNHSTLDSKHTLDNTTTKSFSGPDRSNSLKNTTEQSAKNSLVYPTTERPNNNLFASTTSSNVMENGKNKVSNEVTSIEDKNKVNKQRYMKNPVTKTEEKKNYSANFPNNSTLNSVHKLDNTTKSFSEPQISNSLENTTQQPAKDPLVYPTTERPNNNLFASKTISNVMKNDKNKVTNKVTSIEDKNKLDKQHYIKNPITKTEETKNNTVNLPNNSTLDSKHKLDNNTTKSFLEPKISDCLENTTEQNAKDPLLYPTTERYNNNLFDSKTIRNVMETEPEKLKVTDPESITINVSKNITEPSKPVCNKTGDSQIQIGQKTEEYHDIKEHEKHSKNKFQKIDLPEDLNDKTTSNEYDQDFKQDKVTTKPKLLNRRSQNINNDEISDTHSEEHNLDKKRSFTKGIHLLIKLDALN